MGVSSFLLFVEGKAASPNVSRVLETIPVSWFDFECEMVYLTILLFVLPKFWSLIKMWFFVRGLKLYIEQEN